MYLAVLAEGKLILIDVKHSAGQNQIMLDSHIIIQPGAGAGGVDGGAVGLAPKPIYYIVFYCGFGPYRRDMGRIHILGLTIISIWSCPCTVRS